jgi:hypothetical protein
LTRTSKATHRPIVRLEIPRPAFMKKTMVPESLDIVARLLRKKGVHTQNGSSNYDARTYFVLSLTV